jgi:hypothetical protein
MVVNHEGMEVEVRVLDRAPPSAPTTITLPNVGVTVSADFYCQCYQVRLIIVCARSNLIVRVARDAIAAVQHFGGHVPWRSDPSAQALLPDGLPRYVRSLRLLVVLVTHVSAFAHASQSAPLSAVCSMCFKRKPVFP